MAFAPTDWKATLKSLSFDQEAHLKEFTQDEIEIVLPVKSARDVEGNPITIQNLLRITMTATMTTMPRTMARIGLMDLWEGDRREHSSRLAIRARVYCVQAKDA